jgi:hypothetical protein
MKDSFNKFRDLLYFNVLKSIRVKLSKPPYAYILGLFVVFDWNNRPLIAATVFLSECSTKTFQSLFEMFL